MSLSKLTSFSGRTSLSEKFYFQIKVLKLTLSNSDSLEKDASFHVFIERGNKTATTIDREIKKNGNGNCTIDFNDDLAIDTGLTLNAENKYLEKNAKISIRRKKKGLLSNSQVIGTVSLPLNLIAIELEEVSKTYLLENCSFIGSKIQLIISHRTDVSY
jgi:hypothetical protein